MRNRPIVYKGFGGEVEVANRTVSGYLASFGNKDSDSDIILKGAFSKSLNDRGVGLSLIHISEPTRRTERSRMPSSA